MADGEVAVAVELRPSFFLHRLTVSEAWKNGEFSLENRAGRAACRSERCEK